MGQDVMRRILHAPFDILDPNSHFIARIVRSDNHIGCSLITVVLTVKSTLAYLAAALLGAGLFVPLYVHSAEKVGPPNILVIMADEHNAGVLGCYGNSIVRTPNLDQLASRGVLFEGCYCNSPLCVPSRLSFTSGKYVSRVSAWNNDQRLPADTPSLPRILNARGYESFLCGKMHYDATCRYGFTEIGGNMNTSHMTGYGGRRDPDDLKSAQKLSSRLEQAEAGDKSRNFTHDHAVTAGTVEFLKNRKPGDKPFFLLAGYISPHFPLIVPQKYVDHYKDKVPMPVIPENFLDTLPLNYRHLRVGFRVDNVPPDVVKRARELYYGLVEWTDEQIGQVLSTLEASGLASNTIVIYTADHGENLGEHGMWWKNCLYNSAARVPLIVSWPARWPGGQRRTEACSLVDVVQTIAELGGAKTPADWNGDSMVTWLDQPKTVWKDRAVTEYYAHIIASGYAMIRSGQYKYVYHTAPDAKHPAQRELYDLKADPGEFHNLAAEANRQDLVKQLHAALVKEVGEDPESVERRCRVELAKGYGGKAKGKKGKQPKDD